MAHPAPGTRTSLLSPSAGSSLHCVQPTCSHVQTHPSHGHPAQGPRRTHRRCSAAMFGLPQAGSRAGTAAQLSNSYVPVSRHPHSGSSPVATRAVPTIVLHPPPAAASALEGTHPDPAHFHPSLLVSKTEVQGISSSTTGSWLNSLKTHTTPKVVKLTVEHAAVLSDTGGSMTDTVGHTALAQHVLVDVATTPSKPPFSVLLEQLESVRHSPPSHTALPRSMPSTGSDGAHTQPCWQDVADQEWSIVQPPACGEHREEPPVNSLRVPWSHPMDVSSMSSAPEAATQQPSVVQQSASGTRPEAPATQRANNQSHVQSAHRTPGDDTGTATEPQEQQRSRPGRKGSSHALMGVTTPGPHPRVKLVKIRLKEEQSRAPHTALPSPGSTAHTAEPCTPQVPQLPVRFSPRWTRDPPATERSKQPRAAGGSAGSATAAPQHATSRPLHKEQSSTSQRAAAGIQQAQAMTSTVPLAQFHMRARPRAPQLGVQSQLPALGDGRLSQQQQSDASVKSVDPVSFPPSRVGSRTMGEPAMAKLLGAATNHRQLAILVDKYWVVQHQDVTVQLAAVARYAALTEYWKTRQYRLPQHEEQQLLDRLTARMLRSTAVSVTALQHDSAPIMAASQQSSAQHSGGQAQHVDSQQVAGKTAGGAPTSAMARPLDTLDSDGLHCLLRSCRVLGYRNMELLEGCEALLLQHADHISDPRHLAQCITDLAYLLWVPVVTNAQAALSGSSRPARRGDLAGHAGSNSGSDSAVTVQEESPAPPAHDSPTQRGRAAAAVQRVESVFGSVMQSLLSNDRDAMEALQKDCVLDLLYCCCMLGWRVSSHVNAFQRAFRHPRLTTYTATELCHAIHCFSKLTRRPPQTLAARMVYALSQAPGLEELSPRSFMQLYQALASWQVQVAHAAPRVKTTQSQASPAVVPAPWGDNMWLEDGPECVSAEHLAAVEQVLLHRLEAQVCREQNRGVRTQLLQVLSEAVEEERRKAAPTGSPEAREEETHNSAQHHSTAAIGPHSHSPAASSVCVSEQHSVRAVLKQQHGAVQADGGRSTAAGSRQLGHWWFTPSQVCQLVSVMACVPGFRLQRATLVAVQALLAPSVPTLTFTDIRDVTRGLASLAEPSTSALLWAVFHCVWLRKWQVSPPQGQPGQSPPPTTVTTASPVAVAEGSAVTARPSQSAQEPHQSPGRSQRMDLSDLTRVAYTITRMWPAQWRAPAGKVTAERAAAVMAWFHHSLVTSALPRLQTPRDMPSTRAATGSMQGNTTAQDRHDRLTPGKVAVWLHACARMGLRDVQLLAPLCDWLAPRIRDLPAEACVQLLQALGMLRLPHPAIVREIPRLAIQSWLSPTPAPNSAPAQTHRTAAVHASWCLAQLGRPNAALNSRLVDVLSPVLYDIPAQEMVMLAWAVAGGFCVPGSIPSAHTVFLTHAASLGAVALREGRLRARHAVSLLLACTMAKVPCTDFTAELSTALTVALVPAAALGATTQQTTAEPQARQSHSQPQAQQAQQAVSVGVKPRMPQAPATSTSTPTASAPLAGPKLFQPAVAMQDHPALGAPVTPSRPPVPASTAVVVEPSAKAPWTVERSVTTPHATHQRDAVSVQHTDAQGSTADSDRSGNTEAADLEQDVKGHRRPRLTVLQTTDRAPPQSWWLLVRQLRRLVPARPATAVQILTCYDRLGASLPTAVRVALLDIASSSRK